MENTKNNKKASPQEVHIAVRVIIASILLVIGVIVPHRVYFDDNPLFEVRFLAEVLIAFVTALLGFFTIPRLFVQVKYWVETLIIKTVSDIVTNFWDEQTKRMQDARRKKQKEDARKKEEKLKDKLSNGVLLDTSVLVDGRVLDIVKTGFLDKTLVVPQVVLDELHLIADSDNSLKRKRGRRGLDLLKSLKKEAEVEFIDEYKGKDGADKALVQLAKKYKIGLVTLDFNLNKVAGVAGVKVLNINELVNAVRPQVLPGEEMSIKIVQEGKEVGQGVGYLEDGTMIVVEKAGDRVGSKVNVKVTKSIQGPAGRMIFSEMEG